MLDQLLNDFKNELSLVTPSLVELFNPPVSHEMLLDAEREIGRPLPEALKKFYLIHDGQADGPGLFFDWTILSLKQLVKEWQVWDQIEDFYEATLAVDSISVPRGCIQERYSCQNWIPIGKDFAGNNYAVDMEPDSLGISGQIIVFGRDYDFKYVLATSLEEFIAYLTAQLKSGQYQIEDELCITIEPPQYKRSVENPETGSVPKTFIKRLLRESEYASWKKSLAVTWQEALSSKLTNIKCFDDLDDVIELSLLRTNITDLAPIAKFKELRELIASATKITSLRGLTTNNHLKKLFLGNTPLENLDGIEQCHHLVNLCLSSSPISSLSKLSSLKRLQNLSIDGTKVNSLDEIALLTNIIELNISNTKISSLTVLANYCDLLSLDISNTQVTDLSILKKLTKLTSLNISGLLTADYWAISTCKNIKFIACEYHQFEIIKDILTYKPKITLVGAMSQAQEASWNSYLESGC